MIVLNSIKEVPKSGWRVIDAGGYKAKGFGYWVQRIELPNGIVDGKEFKTKKALLAWIARETV